MIDDDRLESLRASCSEAKANGDPTKYMAGLTVEQAHDIASALSELLALRITSVQQGDVPPMVISRAFDPTTAHMFATPPMAEGIVELVLGRIGQDFDGEAHFTEAEARQIASTISSLTAERDAARELASEDRDEMLAEHRRLEAALATARDNALEEAAKVVAEYLAEVVAANEEGRAVLTAAGLRTSETSRRGDLLSVLAEDVPGAIRALKDSPNV